MINLQFIFDSNFTIALATLLVGGFAIYLYQKQKFDFKRDAASLILIDIRNAEAIINSLDPILTILRANLLLNYDHTYMLSRENWDKYAYLFSKDFDSDELILITTFYNQTVSISRALYALSLDKSIEQKAIQFQVGLSGIAQNAAKQVEYSKKAENFVQFYGSEGHLFVPVALINNLENLVNSVEPVTTSSAGIKLKKLARKGNLFARLFSRPVTQ